MADDEQPVSERGADPAEPRRQMLERLVIVLAALVCLFPTGLLRDVSDRALWMSQIVAPPLPDGVGERTSTLVVSVTDAEGAPAEGVTVRVFAMIDGEAYLAEQGTTGPGGELRLERLPGGEVWIIAEKKGLARTSSRAVLEPGERKIELRLVPAESFEVVVVDPMQRPIRGVTVTLYGSDPLPFRALTDDRGLARLEGLGPPPYAIEVTATGFDSKLIPKVTLEESPLFVKLERLGSLEVAVVDGEGKPVADATVLVAGSSLWPARSASTAATGSVTISGLPRGFYDVRAEKDNLVSDTQEGLLLERGEHKRIELTLIEGTFVTVLVTDGEAEDAKPLPGADVALVEGGISSFPRYGRTGGDGKVRLGPMVGSDAVVSARADGFVPKSAVRLDEGQLEVRIGLIRGGKLIGRVIDERDFPIEGVRLEVIGVDVAGMPIMESSASTSFRDDHFAFALPGATPLIPAGELGVMPVIPDIPFGMGPLLVTRREGGDDAAGGFGWVSKSDGTFELSPVTPGRVRIVARHPSYIETVSEAVDLAIGGEAELTIVMKKGGILEGRVLELDRSPVPGARVEVASAAGSADRITYTAEDGSFAFAALPSEVIVSVARAEAPDHIVERLVFDVPPEERREVEIILPRLREPVTFRVLDDRGYPLDRAEIRVSSLEPTEPLVRTLFSDDAGDAELPQARGLPLRVEVRRRGKAPAVSQIERAPAHVELSMFEALSATGVIESRWGSVEGAEITLLTPTGAKKARSDAEGAFRFEDLAPSDVRLVIEAAGYVTEVHDKPIDGDSRRPVDLGRFELKQGGAIKGVVRDESGDPVAGVRVAAGRVPTYLPLGQLPKGIVLTDARGEFTLEDIEPGNVDLETYKIGYERQAVFGVVVRAGDVNSTVEIELVQDPSLQDEGPGTSGSLAVTLGEMVTGGRRIIVFEHVPLSGEAARAGILPGDRMIAFNGLAVRSLEQARRFLNGPLSEDFVLELGREPDMRWRVRVKRERLRR